MRGDQDSGLLSIAASINRPAGTASDGTFDGMFDQASMEHFTEHLVEHLIEHLMERVCELFSGNLESEGPHGQAWDCAGQVD